MLGQVVFPVGFTGGLLTGVLAAALAALVWRRARPALARVRYLFIAGLLVSFALAAGALYLSIGMRATTPGAAGGANGAARAQSDAPPGGSAPGRSMELEVSALEARLARGGGSEADWTLLAQAYEFLGRPEDARRARAHTTGAAAAAPVISMSAETLAAAAAASAPASGASLPKSAASSAAAVDEPGASVTSLEAQVSAHPSDASGWLALAELRRTQHDYAAARLAYSKVVGLGAMSAQSWADYADVLGSLADGSLTGEAAGAIDNALRLDPDNSKALWLKASQAHEQHRYAAALEGWRRLRKLLPPDSPDLQIIEGNIAEAESLAAGAPAVAAGTSTTVSTRVSGTVSLDARFSDRVPRDATLFIYAKAADSPGPPLAVLRLTPNAWPVSFHLDDSMAMLPSRRLSQFEKVIVEARISRTGQAAPQSGDLYVTSPVVQPASAGKLTLLIDREIS